MENSSTRVLESLLTGDNNGSYNSRFPTFCHSFFRIGRQRSRILNFNFAKSVANTQIIYIKASSMLNSHMNHKCQLTNLPSEYSNIYGTVGTVDIIRAPYSYLIINKRKHQV